MKTVELANALIEIERSSKWITVHRTDEKRLTFEDDRAWSFFSPALDPWNDFRFVWLRNILELLAAHLAGHGSPEDFDLHGHIELHLASELVGWVATGKIGQLTSVNRGPRESTAEKAVAQGLDPDE